MDGVPAPVVTNSQGYVSPFQCDPGVSAVLASFGSVTLPLIDQTAVLQAGAAAVAAQTAAEDAAELVGAPADLAIAAAVLAVDSATRNALDSVLGDGTIAGLVNNEDSATRRAITEHFGDAAVASRIGSGTATRAALDARYGTDTGVLTSGLAIVPQTKWTIAEYQLQRRYGHVYGTVTATYAGTAVNADTGGNFGDVNAFQLPEGWWPAFGYPEILVERTGVKQLFGRANPTGMVTATHAAIPSSPALEPGVMYKFHTNWMAAL